ncbi:MAG: protein-glutamate O-methyltransferase CheR [Pseudomonadota bacterium]
MQLNGGAARQLEASSSRQPGSLSTGVFHSIAALVEREAGIQLQTSKILMVGSRISKRLKALSIDSFEDYLEFLNSSDSGIELKELINVLTTNVTAFFREQHHFDDFENAVLPSLIERARAGDRIRIWSAGCSIGAEPYSLALVINKHFQDASSHDFKILATDIDHDCLNKAIAGRYPREQIDSEIPPHFRAKFRDVDDDSVEVCSTIKKLITVRKLNLIRPWPFKGRFATIFCRNVVIYFGADLTNQMWSQFTERLEPEGRLYIGHSERVKGSALDHLKPVGITTYQRNGS